MHRTQLRLELLLNGIRDGSTHRVWCRRRLGGLARGAGPLDHGIDTFGSWIVRCSVGWLFVSALTVQADPPSDGQANVHNNEQDPAQNYATYAATLATVSRHPNARTSVQEGWTVIEVAAADSIAMWSFTPAGHPAHPSAVRRRLRLTEQGPLVDMDLLCEATAQQCTLLGGQLRRFNQHLGATP